MRLPTSVVHEGHVIGRLRQLAAGSVHMVVTSPPYWGLRDYKNPPTAWGGDEACAHEWGEQERGRRQDVLPSESSEAGRLGSNDVQAGQNDGGRLCRRCDAWLGQLGLEPTPDLYVEHIVEVFREVRRVLRADGTLWLSLGDCFSHGGCGARDQERWPKQSRNDHIPVHAKKLFGLKPKDLVGIPWRAAFALQADGWWLRSDVVWHKRSPMPENVRDRPTRSHEFVFLLAKAERYYYDWFSVMEPDCGHHGSSNGYARPERLSFDGRGSDDPWVPGGGRHLRDVWTLSSSPYPDAHFAVFPESLVEPCVKAGTSERGCCTVCGAPWKRLVKRTRLLDGEPWPDATAMRTTSISEPTSAQGVAHRRITSRVTSEGWTATCGHAEADCCPATVLDPFAGSGTTGVVASRLGRSFVGIDLNPEYAQMARRRIEAAAPLFAWAAGRSEVEPA